MHKVSCAVRKGSQRTSKRPALGAHLRHRKLHQAAGVVGKRAAPAISGVADLNFPAAENAHPPAAISRRPDNDPTQRQEEVRELRGSTVRVVVRTGLERDRTLLAQRLRLDARKHEI